MKMSKFIIETTTGTVIFTGKFLEERTTEQWLCYETESGDIYHFKKDHMIYILEKEII